MCLFYSWFINIKTVINEMTLNISVKLCKKMEFTINKFNIIQSRKTIVEMMLASFLYLEIIFIPKSKLPLNR